MMAVEIGGDMHHSLPVAEKNKPDFRQPGFWRIRISAYINALNFRKFFDSGVMLDKILQTGHLTIG